jgi:hypothetical protein
MQVNKSAARTQRDQPISLRALLEFPYVGYSQHGIKVLGPSLLN